MIIEAEINRPVYECDECKRFIDFDTDSYFSDDTFNGKCTGCGKRFRCSCCEVDDAHWLRGDYCVGGKLYRSFENMEKSK